MNNSAVVEKDHAPHEDDEWHDNHPPVVEQMKNSGEDDDVGVSEIDDARAGTESPYTRGQLIGLISGPVLCLILSFIPMSEEYPKAQRMVGMTAWIVSWWISMVVPLGITALLPIIMFPLLEISTAADITSSYFNSTSFMFIGAFMVNFGIEKVELNKRVALKIVLKMGSSPRMLLLSIMLATSILSGFCSNTSTTLMMVPFALGILEEGEAEAIERGEDTKKVESYGKGMLIGIAWAASIGGSTTLVGTAGPASKLFRCCFSMLFLC